MLWNYLIIGLRHLRQSTFYSLLNILGLAVGIGCVLLAMLYVEHQFRFDQHHEKSDRIYLLMRKLEDAGGTHYDLGTKPVAPHLRGRFPEVEAVTRTLMRSMWASRGNRGSSARVCVTDAEMFDIFTLPMVAGDPQTGLNAPNTAFLSQALARKLFGEEDPINKTVKIKYKWLEGYFTITGIMKNQPKTSNDKLRFDFLTTTYPPNPQWRPRVWEIWPSAWPLGPLRTYVLLRENADVAELKQKLRDFAAEHQSDAGDTRYDYDLQPLDRVHLYSMQNYGTAEANAGDITRCYILLAVGLLVLLIACINYVNLVTARSANRVREVGLRKVVGATRLQLMGQFLGESLLLVLPAGVLAVLFASSALPFFNDILEVDLNLTDAGLAFAALFSLLTLSGVGLAAGTYPAFVLSGFDPVRALKGALRFRRAGLNQVMVILQFGVSVILIICTLVVYLQLVFVRSKELGFDKEQIVILPFFLKDRDLRPKVGAILNELRGQQGVLNASAFHLPPGQIAVDAKTMRAEGHGNEKFKLYWNAIDDDYLASFGLSLAAGRDLAGISPRPRKIGPNKWESATLINETAAKMLGWDEPVGKFLTEYGGRLQVRVIGVVKDYHNQSLHYGIEPMMLQNSTSLSRVAVRLAPGDLQARLAGLESVWKQFLPMRPFEYEFLDERLDAYYKAELTLQEVTGVFAALSIFISCLGMLGLIAFAAQQRTKEIGIRKVLGASTAAVILLLTRNFLWLAAIANLIGWPVAYYVMSAWLDNFAYRISLGPMVFLVTGLVSLGIVFITVGGQAYRVASANPANALRDE